MVIPVFKMIAGTCCTLAEEEFRGILQFPLSTTRRIVARKRPRRPTSCFSFIKMDVGTAGGVTRLSATSGYTQHLDLSNVLSSQVNAICHECLLCHQVVITSEIWEFEALDCDSF